MLHIRDISLRKRLLLTNFLMVCIPVILLFCLGAIIFAGLRFTGTARQSELALLWPEKGSSMSVTYAISSLRTKVDNKKVLHLEDIFEECLILEKHNILVVIISDGRLLYLSPDTDISVIQNTVYRQFGSVPSALLWKENSFAFAYTSHDGITSIWAAGETPFVSPYSEEDTSLRNLLEGMLLCVLILAILLIIWLGLSLSRLMSQQILTPLAKLRRAAAEIKKGNFEYPLHVSAQDELGQTCHAFDDMRQELHHARKERLQYEQNRKELIAGISHDLATPLTLLKGYTSGIRDGIAQTPEKQAQYMDRIYATTCTMEQLVDSLFLFSKLDLGRIPFTLETVPISRCVRDMVQEMAFSLHDTGMALMMSPLRTDVPVRLDTMQFHRVLQNIVANSIKYKTTETAAMEINLCRHTNTVSIACIDHGAGVPAESLPKLFDTFYRTDKARTDVTKGNGLGLAIAKQIITSLGGVITASETPDGGLTITITLPIAKEE